MVLQNQQSLKIALLQHRVIEVVPQPCVVVVIEDSFVAQVGYPMIGLIL